MEKRKPIRTLIVYKNITLAGWPTYKQVYPPQQLAGEGVEFVTDCFPLKKDHEFQNTLQIAFAGT